MLERCQSDNCDDTVLGTDRWLDETDEEDQDQVSQVTAQKDEHDSSDDDQCWYCDKLKFLELCFTAAAEETSSASDDWWVSSDIHKQQLSAEADSSLTAVSAAVSDDAADSNTVTDAWEWAEQEHADVMCTVHLSSDSMKKHLIHSAALSQKNTAWDSYVNVQMTEEKTEQ